MFISLLSMLVGCQAHKLCVTIPAGVERSPADSDEWIPLTDDSTLELGPLFVPAAHHPPETLAALYAQFEPEEVFREAIRRRRAGDIEGALHRLVWLRNVGDTSPAVLYQLAVSYESDEDFEMAVRVYDLLLSESEEIAVRRDTGFRRAQALEELGRDREALRQLRHIQPPEGGFGAKDQLTFDIERYSVERKLGKRSSHDRLVDALQRAETRPDITYIRAKGWSNLIVTQLEESSEEALIGDDGELRARTEARATTILESELLMAGELIPLGEPRWILDSFLVLGDAYATLASDVRAAPAPASLTSEQSLVYSEMIAEQVGILQRRAWARYDTALTYAGTLGLETRHTEALRERLEQAALVLP